MSTSIELTTLAKQVTHHILWGCSVIITLFLKFNGMMFWCYTDVKSIKLTISGPAQGLQIAQQIPVPGTIHIPGTYPYPILGGEFKPLGSFNSYCHGVTRVDLW
jgi:hypothetical protein